MNYKNSKLIFKIKPANSFQALAILTFTILLLAFFAGCRSADTDDHKQGTDTARIKTESGTSAHRSDTAAVLTVIGEPLYIYYTDATTMYNLVLKDLHKKGKGKIVFQFYVNNGDTLTLAAFSGENGKFKDPTIMNHSKSPVDYITKKLLLADQEMSKKNYNGNNDVQTLLDFLDNHSNSSGGYDGFVGFVPKVVPLDQTGYYTIQYSTYWYPENEEPLIAGKQFNSVLLKNVSLNPSPPRNSYQ